MPIIQIHRKPLPGRQSFERLFSTINRALPEDIKVHTVYPPCHSKGLTRRILNVLALLFTRGRTIHITGDLHYLSFSFPFRKRILTIHDLAAFHSRTGWRKRLWGLCMINLPMRFATVVTTISEAVKAELVEASGVDPAKIVVIPNCIDPAFRPVPKPWSDIPIVLFVGTRPQKNLERMMSALEGLPVNVHIVGELTEVQEAHFNAIGVPWTALGRLSDEAVINAFKTCDCLAFASTYEGFGLPVIEAQATGRPVLTSDIPVLREVAGEGACFVDPIDVESIRAGFRRILDDFSYRESLVQNGYKNVQRFTREATAAAYAAIYLRTDE